MKKILAGIIVGLVLGGSGSAYAVSRKQSESNDNVYVGTRQEFKEFYKQDAPGGDKNYIYTVTNRPIPAQGTCDIYTFDSETYAFPVCNPLPNGQR